MACRDLGRQLLKIKTLGRMAAAAVCGAAVLAACDEGPVQPQAAVEPPSVHVINVQRQEVQDQVEFVGRVQAIERVELRARIEGFLERRNFREGEFVEAGTLMFEIEPDTFAAEVEMARAGVAAAEARKVEADANLDRALQLIERGNIAERSVDEAQAAAQTTEAEVLARTAELRQAEINLSYTEIRTPIAGRVSRETFSAGNLVSPESGPLATVTSLDPISVIFSVSEADLIDAELARQQRGEEVDLRDRSDSNIVPRIALPDGTLYEHPGRIDFLGAEVDPATGTVPIRAVFPNPNSLLLHGQFATIVLTSAETQNKIVIPVAAVQEDQVGPFVLVLNEDKAAEIRRIERGQTQEINLIVEQGLEEGEVVVVEGLQKIRPGVPVTPIFRDGAPLDS